MSPGAGVVDRISLTKSQPQATQYLSYYYYLQADRGCARLQLLLNMCSSKEDGTYYNQFSRYFTTVYGMIHHKRGGTLCRGYGLKEQEMTM